MIKKTWFDTFKIKQNQLFYFIDIQYLIGTAVV